MAKNKTVISFSLTFMSMITLLMAAQQIYPALQPVYHQHYYQMNPYPNTYYQPPALYRHNVTNSTVQIRSHDFVLGVPSPREKLLLHSTVYKKPGLWSSYAVKEITFPPKGSHLRVNITRIYATDRAKNGTGAFVKLTNGGIGKQNVTLVFRSQKNQPINFEIDIFGLPK